MEKNVNIVVATIRLLMSDKFYGVSNDVEIAKGKNAIKSIWNLDKTKRDFYMKTRKDN